MTTRQKAVAARMPNARPQTAARTIARVSASTDAFEQQAARRATAVVEGTAATANPRRRIPVRPGFAVDASAALSRHDGMTLVHDVHPLSGGGEPLPATLRADMEARFGHDFGSVRLHRDGEAARSAATLHARAYTSGSHIVLGDSLRNGSAPESRALIAHELAHVVQQADVGALAAGAWLQRQPTELSAIPESERRAIRTSTIAVSIPAETIREFFTVLPSGRPGTTQSVGATNRFGANIPAALHTGLGSVGAWLAGTSNALPLNSTIEIDLDLTAFGGAATTYRFTYFAHATGSGSTASTVEVMLVEQIGAALARPATRTAQAGAFTVNTTGFTLAGSWSDADFTVLHEALSLLPASALAGAAGLTFRRVGGSVGVEGGHYDTTTDTVELNDRAFPAATQLRFGQRPAAVRAVLHEVGHALDLRELERAWRAYGAAGQTATARRTLLAARSRSGSRWGRVAGSTDTDEIQERADDQSPEFRRAVARDGVRRDTSGTRTTPEGTTATLAGGATTYSDTDYQELFAESFALYVAQPQTLQQLRPHTYAYFLRMHPR